MYLIQGNCHPSVRCHVKGNGFPGDPAHSRVGREALRVKWRTQRSALPCYQSKLKYLIFHSPSGNWIYNHHASSGSFVPPRHNSLKISYNIIINCRVYDSCDTKRSICWFNLINSTDIPDGEKNRKCASWFTKIEGLKLFWNSSLS